MLKSIKSLFTLLVVMCIATPTVIATEIKSGEHVVIASDTVIEGDYFTAGDTVTLSGTVNGDLYVAGGNLTLEGTINGDILAAGGNITLLGTVEQDIRVVGGNIIISGAIGRNVTVIGGSVQVTDSAEIQGNVVAVGGSIQLFAPVPGSVTIAGGDVELGSSVTGDVFAAVGNLRMTPNGSVGGNLTYYSEDELLVPQGASVSGEIVKKDYPQGPELDEDQKEHIRQAGQAAQFGSKLLNVISAFIIGSLLLKFFPQYTQHISKRVSGSPWKSMGLGLLFLIVAPITTFILLITIIGIPLAMALLFTYFFFIYLAKIFISLVLGEKLLGYFNKEYNPYIVLLTGLFLYLILTSIPVVGWLITFVSVLIGIGAILLGKKDYYEEAKLKKVV